MREYKKFIKEALKLAEKGKGLVSPNPMVGAVIVKGSQIVGKGWHKAFGMPHGEIEALKEAGDKAKGATLYANLEPCCHYGKTPPCTKAIIEAGIKEVICSIEDPNPLVAGKGIKELEKNGIAVRTNILREEAEVLNRPYITYITKKRPYIIWKWAQTIDGKIATCKGSSKWITGQDTRDFVKRLRFEVDGIVVGIKTVIRDNPSLDYIAPAYQTKKDILNRKRYWKIITDPYLKIPEEGKIWKNHNSKILLVVSEKVEEERIRYFIGERGCDVVRVPEEQGRLNLKLLMEELYKREIGIIMVEGGSYTFTSFWEEKLADEVMVFTANKILGGNTSLSPIAGKGRECISEAVKVEYYETKMLRDDFFIRGRICFQG
ncbi:MAG: bifunctional diaminohydroxyphosphoribosylaminopyrimidine deaminase/5-amino-6-(5-phosphoribosylamino)uracil reductase RibD [Candidatus Omnitrophica bacterium]|nr:bifunctional diaminohydroxyphosphoribosylaminopyrimidine deaminase/5-amino-6-(5-phosphoribosylamino)uracil reductase RibD [Candidatus Omnitrophota bacterium]